MNSPNYLLSIYCAHPMTGCSPKDVEEYYADRLDYLGGLGYRVFHPLVAKSVFRNAEKYCSSGNKHPVSTDHAIYGRDRWMIRNSDVLLLDLRESTEVSIGCMMELAIASDREKHTITVLDSSSSVYRHAFVLEASDIIFTTLEDADGYLKALITGAVDFQLKGSLPTPREGLTPARCIPILAIRRESDSLRDAVSGSNYPA